MNAPAKVRGTVTRRDFVRATAAAVAVAPLIAPARFFGAGAPSNRLRVGHIGCGRIACGHDMPGVAQSGLADVLAVCDVDSRRAAWSRHVVERLFAGSQRPAPKIGVYGDYREVLARPDIDAVVISLPDHWHAEVAIAAVLAGKDVYLQKPFTMTHAESVLLRNAVAQTGRILQVGSQQRSWGPHEQFRKACEFVRSGRVGQLRRVEIGLPVDPTAPDDPEQPVPANLNYDAWLGPTPKVYYTEQRVHAQKLDPKTGGPDVTSRPGWLRNESYCLGMITGWGAHHFDTAHWGMGQELGGPSRIEGRGEFPTNRIWNVHGAYHVELTYPGGVKMTVTDKFDNGIKFIGDDGWIFVCRDTGTSPTASLAATANVKWLTASDPKLLEPSDRLAVQFPHSTSHHRNWLECVKSRAQPLAPAPVAHGANTACIVSWIAMKLGRPLDWDMNAGRFVNDAEANALLARPERAPYGAGRLVQARG
jgi:predicted dehydrogenase